MVETIINGILLGGLYGLLGLGLALAFGVMRVINIAHGEFIVLTAYIGLGLTHLLPGVSPFLLLPVVLATAFLLGYALQALLINQAVASRDMTVPMLVTFGVSVVIRNVLVETVGVDPRHISAGHLEQASISGWGLRVGALPLLTLLISLALFMILQFTLKHTQFGRIVRATADNREVVRLMGVNPARIYNLVMGVALVLAGVAGLLLAMRASFTPFSGIDRLLISFEVVVLGGLGSFWGAMLGGIALGIAQLVGLHFDSNSGLLYAHLLFFVVILVRPNGLLGARA